MSDRAKELAARFTAFNDEMISFVETCSDENWKKMCEGENWTIGLVARHVLRELLDSVGVSRVHHIVL